jgi:hypothetical protein
MKLYAFTNVAFEKLRDRFVATLKDDYEVIIKEAFFSQAEGCTSSQVWIFKMEMTIDAIKNNLGDRIIVSDIDIQFFRPTLPLIESCPEVDLLIQFEQGRIEEVLNTGFMVIKCSRRTFRFFDEVLECCKHPRRNVLDEFGTQAGNIEGDQGVVNRKIRTERRLSWAFLPKEIWMYTPGSIPPANIAAHHATFAGSVEEKLEQMDKISVMVRNNE